MGARPLERRLLVAAASALIAIGASGLAATQGLAGYVVIGFPPQLTFDMGFAPKKLSKTSPTPVVWRIGTRVDTPDGSLPPGLRELQIEVDRDVKVGVKGLPTCHFSVEGPGNPGSVCRKALVGTGAMNIAIAFPEAAEVFIHSRALVFNGGEAGGVTTLYVYDYLTVPVPAVIVTTMKVKRIKKGHRGLLASATFSKIAGGSGSITSFNLKIDKKFTYKGERMSVVSAKCPDRKLAWGVSTLLADGTRFATDGVQPCTGKS